MHLLKGSRIALKAVTAHKGRALLAILGIVVGVATVIVMLAVGEGAFMSGENQSRADIDLPGR